MEALSCPAVAERDILASLSFLSTSHGSVVPSDDLVGSSESSAREHTSCGEIHFLIHCLLKIEVEMRSANNIQHADKSCLTMDHDHRTCLGSLIC